MKTSEIFISTGGFRNLTAIQALEKLHKAEIQSVELSGGLFDSEFENKIGVWKNRLKIQCHNYFPPPSQPFVFNLASAHLPTLEKSLNLAKTAISLTSKLGAKQYAFHAGFRFDPDVRELGQVMGSHKLYLLEEAEFRFVKHVKALSAYAEGLGVQLLIENNVLSASNLDVFGENPFLAVTPEDTFRLLNACGDKVGLLLDVAHWKVSAKSLALNLDSWFGICDPLIKGYHLSDNDGNADSNQPVTRESWFWSRIDSQKGPVTLEIYGQEPGDLMDQINITAEMIAR